MQRSRARSSWHRGEVSSWPCWPLPVAKLTLRPKSSPGPRALSPHPALYLVAASQASMTLASHGLLRCSVLLRHVPRTPLTSTKGKWVTRSTQGEAGMDVIGVMLQNLAAYGQGHYSRPTFSLLVIQQTSPEPPL